MCGIFGKYSFDPVSRVDHILLKRMGHVLTHRGPDEDGYYIWNNIGLGHRRLSIIDLKTGQQPIYNEDRKIWIVFNGEIYNFQELREELIRAGHVFSTNTDTEVIIHLYEEKGEEFVTFLRGMVAFALWDERERKLILARDRVGEKPLFYALLPNRCLLFASEIKAFLEDEEVSRSIDLEALDQYLAFLYVPAPNTVFKGIKKLPPGHILICTPDKVTVKEYWDLVYQPTNYLNEQAYAEELYEILNEAVRIRLVSDVPLGAFLSGGIDSSSVVALMAGMMPSRVVTCSVGFQEEDHNELPYARILANHYHCDHHEFLVQPKIQDILPKIVWHFDEPFADSSAIPTYYVSQAARRHVTVALSGDGGDEGFAGYSRHFLERLEHSMRRFTGYLDGRTISRMLSLVPSWARSKPIMSPSFKMRWEGIP